MAGTISWSNSFNVVNGSYSYLWAYSDSYVQTTLGSSAGIINTTTSMADIPVGSVATNGFLLMKNLDATNSVDWGIDSSGFVGVGTMKPGEQVVFRVKTGVVPAVKAVASTPAIVFLFLNA